VVRGCWPGVSETTSAFLLQVKTKNVLNILRITQNLLVRCDGKTKGVAKGAGEWCG
jgi:hypothetical protein